MPKRTNGSQPITLEEAADRVAALLRQAEFAELAGDDARTFHEQAFAIAAQALQADPPAITVWDNNYGDGTDG
jgi:hypothetical protein